MQGKTVTSKDVAKEDVQQPQISNKRVILWGLSILVAGFLLLQILPLTASYTNPPVLAEPAWNSLRTRELTVRACWDCHSNETRWPWYSYIAPASQVIRRDVMNGRKALNFSEWGHGGGLEVEEITETISKHQMPLSYYIILNPEADLTNVERSELIYGLIATVREKVLETEELNTNSPDENGGVRSRTDEE